MADYNELYQLAYIKQVSKGSVPAANLQEIPLLASSDLGARLETIESQRLRADAQHPGDILSGVNPFANLPLELEPGTYDEIVEAAIRADATWPTAKNLSGTDISFAASDDSINASTTDISVNVSVGDRVFVAGAANAANNGWHTVVSVTSSKIVTDSALTDESAGASITLKGQSIKNGTASPYLAWQLRQLDLTNKYIQMTDTKTGGLTLNHQLGQIFTGNLTLAGRSINYAASSSLGTGVTAAPSRDAMRAIEDFETFSIDHARQTYSIVGVNLNIATPTRPRRGMGQGTTADDIAQGTLRVTAQVSVYLGDSTWDFLTDAVAGTRFRLGWDVLAGNGYRYDYQLPSMLITNPQHQVPQRDQDGQVTFDASAKPAALYTGDTGETTIQISRVAV